MCKPMGNFAENLNLGNRFRPPHLHYLLICHPTVFVMRHIKRADFAALGFLRDEIIQKIIKKIIRICIIRILL